MKKIFLQSLGCPKNLVDSEVMLGLLREAGYEVSQFPEEADIMIINTCGFISSAVEEGIEEILKLAEIKSQNKALKLIVTGCLVQRYQGNLKKELPEVDLFIGTDGFQNIVKQIAGLEREKTLDIPLDKPEYLMNSQVARTISTPAHRAYLKITEGCANRCSYCLIPSLRGPLRSRTCDDLICETKKLSAAGIKELTLVGQDLTSYGLDLGKNAGGLVDLLENILAESAVAWIRLLYLYPSRITEALLDIMAANDRIVPYLDIPLQHVSPAIIKGMNRTYKQENIEKILDKIHTTTPDAALRTTFMVGFPGETEAHVQELEDFMLAHEFDHVGIFTYSNEEGCMAENYPDQCVDEVKIERRERLMAVQADISLKRNQRFVGRTEKVLVEGISQESDLLLAGRTRYQAADDIDGCVYITSGNCHPGDIVDVKITEAHNYDLVGEIIEE